MVDQKFWKNKRVYLTGHTGFKGSWLSLWLQDLGADVRGFALNPPTSPSLFEDAEVMEKIESEIGDIRNKEQLQKSMVEFNPEILIHMAAQSLVRLSYQEPIETYDINVMGTVNVLEAARKCSNLRCIVNVTTDKCYENKEWEWGYRENESLGGYDPYSSSKACAELVTSAYRQSFMQEKNIGLASVRAGNVIGGGDWANDRLIPDILRSFEKNKPVIIRNPKSTRPWQHVLEPLAGYLILAQKLFENPHDFSGAWNFGPNDEDVKPVEWIVDRMVKYWSNNASFILDDKANFHEAHYLKLDCSKSKSKLGWTPQWNLDMALEKIIHWYQAYQQQQNMQQITLEQIKSYQFIK
ncbi:MAG: CDP-glucose 4,6-dehydratase [gamma proteobacterium symbiont of Lucinoma myriamae]|nr:CDP-glucose 4,6-dehydratase [gamma proteobacterium symbiont of Lucinoma myriamae]MCU7819396.1 CDP-glucose 4,6-dehydratase [gamma proteobacterium symbiont of Lucinoma myriamae]